MAATVTRKGQVTLPKRVRDALGLVPGSKVEFEVQNGRVLLRREVPPREAMERWVGYLKDEFRGKTVDQFIEELRGERYRE